MRIYYVGCEFLDAFRGDPDWAVATNCDTFKGDANLPVENLDIGMSYPMAVMQLSESAVGNSPIDDRWNEGRTTGEMVGIR